MNENFGEMLQKRRSIYNLGNKIPLTNQELQQLIETMVLHAPSAFNSQSSRVVILLGDQQQKLWKIVRAKLQEIVPADKFAPTAEKLDAFAAGYGTILFFEDGDIIEELKQKFPTYEENFEIWSEQASAMLQFAVWTALAQYNIGASLQHYNPLIDDEVKKTWEIPTAWKLIAEMPFGNIEANAPEKEFLPIEKRVWVKN